MQVRPSRLLNEKRGSSGLNEMDFVAAGVFFILCSFALSGTPYMLLAFLITLVPILILLPIRLKYRRKIVRDYLKFKIFSGSAYDPKIKKTRS